MDQRFGCNMFPIVISAPFGNYFQPEGAMPTIGTFTWEYRGGFAYRLWRCLRTLRYSRKMGGWVNKLGLPNPGINSLFTRDEKIGTGTDYSEKIVSIHGFNHVEWVNLARAIIEWYSFKAVELNLSCPNVVYAKGSTIIDDVQMPIRSLIDFGKTVIAKLPPIGWMNMAEPLYDLGVRWFHCCNTIRVPGGGLSGKALKPYSILATSEIKYKWGSEVRVIGGGGVTHESDYDDYRKAGADFVSVGSVLLNPFNHRRIRRLINATLNEE